MLFFSSERIPPMNSAYLNSISQSGLFKYLEPSHYETAWQELHMTPRAYEQGQTIYGQGESVTRAAIVHSGIIKGERLSPDGNSSIAYYYSSGDIFAFEGALSGKKTSPLHISAEADSQVVFLDVQRIFGCTYERRLAKGLFELLANDDIKKLYRIETLSKRSLRERIMAHFHILSSRTKDGSFTLNMSREQLAAYLCVNRSALSHELNQMKRDGVIDFQGRKFRIVDRRF